jgi:hypothetical protein
MDGIPSIAVLMHIRPWSESEGFTSDQWLHYLRVECKSVVASQAIGNAIRQGDGQYAEWVSATSPRPGVDATLRTATRASGNVRITVRRAVIAAESDLQPDEFSELLRPNEHGVPFAAACVIPNIEVVRERLVVDKDGERRHESSSLHGLFRDAATHTRVMACLEACLAKAAKAAKAGACHQEDVWGPSVGRDARAAAVNGDGCGRGAAWTAALVHDVGPSCIARHPA